MIDLRDCPRWRVEVGGFQGLSRARLIGYDREGRRLAIGEWVGEGPEGTFMFNFVESRGTVGGTEAPGDPESRTNG